MNLCKEVCLRVVAHLWSTKLAHLSASQFKNSNLSSCNMRGQGKNVLKCVPTHQKWPIYQEFLAHLAGYFCTCEYTMFSSGTKWFIYQECCSKISMRLQQCVRFARYARSLSIICNIRDSQLNRPESVSLASLARQ